MTELSLNFREIHRFLFFVARRFAEDRCPSQAASLSYTMLLSLVPMMAVAVAMFSAFPAFERVTTELIDLALSSFLPEGAASLEGQIRQHLESFLENTGNLPAIGTFMLGVTAVMLLGSIETVMNGIWRIRKPRPPLARLVVFWSLLTIGPLLLGVALYLSSYIFVLREIVGIDSELVKQLTRLELFVPFLLSAIAFSLMFIGMPNRPVQWRDGVLGGVTTAASFEILKKGFGWAITTFPSYETIYGAVATVPIFLIWMYLVWMVILLGAEVAAARSEWRAARFAGGEPGVVSRDLGNAQRLVVALKLLDHLAKSFRTGDLPPRAAQVQKDLFLGPREMDWATRVLTQHGYVQTTEGKRLVLSRDLGRVTLAEFLTQLSLVISPKDVMSEGQGAWHARLTGVLSQLEHDRGERARLTLSQLLEPEKTGAEVVPLTS